MKKLLLGLVLLSSCIQQRSDIGKDLDSTSSDSIRSGIFQYHIAENLILESEKPIPHFELDSINTYSYYSEGGDYTYIKDSEERIFFSTIIGEIRPTMLKEAIYPDNENGKIRYFVFDDEISNDNRNRIFVGVLLSQTEQAKVQEFLKIKEGTIKPQMWTPNSYKQWETQQFDD